MIFSRYERLVIVIIAVLAILDLILIAQKNVTVDWKSYAILIAIGSAIVAVGLYYRHFRNEERLATTLIAAGSFILFTLAGSIFNYMLLPVQFPRIDGWLVRIDADWFGYDWVALVTAVSHYPWLATLLRWVYLTSLPQLIGVVLLLGFFSNEQKLYRFLLTGIFGALICVGVWRFFPSFGASSWFGLPDEINAIVAAPVGPRYGAEIVRLGYEGIHYLTPSHVLGLIGFPSFHTVMAAMAVVFTRHLRFIALPVLLLNILMIPALLVHGGHHFSDFLGGLVVFVIAYNLAGLLIGTGHINKPMPKSNARMQTKRGRLSQK